MLLIFVGIAASLKGQDIHQIAPHVPTSPQAEAFQKYGEYAVNYSTGVPDISIPLYEINHRGYKIPLVLKYNPQPLKPGYNYDVYGHGWGLSVNSCVSRSIEGAPDEWRDFKIEQKKLSDYYFVNPGSAGGYDMELLPHTNLASLNLAHDKFNVVLPNGQSFDFIIDQEDGQGLVFTVSDGGRIKIHCSYSNGDINSFTIVDEEGVKYTFDGSDLPYHGPDTQYASSYVSWKLTRIDLPYSAEPITFEYNYAIESEYSLACREPGILIGDHETASIYTKPRLVIAQDAPAYPPYYYKMKLLSSINYGTTSIRLIYQDQNTTAHYNYVNHIWVYENSSLIRDIQLDKSIKDGLNFCSSYKLAKLDSVSIKGSDLSVPPLVYRCTYQYSDYHFSGTDHWGYLNDYDDSYDVANFNLFVEFNSSEVLNRIRVSAVQKSSQDLCPYDKIKLSQTGFDNRQPATPDRHGVLSSLWFPTGGHTDFEFENHEFLTSTDYNGNYIYDRQNRVMAKAAGFRIKRITNYSSDNTVAKILNYRYGKTNGDVYGPNHIYANDHTGVGEAVVDPNILTYMNYSYYFPRATISPIFIRSMILGLDGNGERTSFQNPLNDDWMTENPWKWECSFSASNFRRIVNGRTPVLYPEVTVYYGIIKDGEKYTPEKTTGKTVYKYNITEHSRDMLDKERDDVFFEEPHYFGNAIDYCPKSYRYNKLEEKDDYKFDGQGYTLVKKENYSWSVSASSAVDYTPSKPYPSNFYYPYVMIINFFSPKPYNLGISLMNSKSTTLYGPGGESMVSTESYVYNNINQLVSKNFTNSEDRKILKTFYYPGTDGSGNTPDIIQKMTAKNMIAPVIKSTTKADNVTTFGYKTDFKEYTIGTSTIIMPSMDYELEVKPSGEEYVVRSEIKGYSANGNPLDFVSKDGIKSGYIWGYSDRYMVVKADNIDNATLTGLVNASLPSGFSTLEALLSSFTTLPNSNWSDFNKNLREKVPANVMVTTYTYAPLIGMTSSTDSNKQTTYYYYDSLGRLVQEKDDKGNILKEYKYHYKE